MNVNWLIFMVLFNNCLFMRDVIISLSTVIIEHFLSRRILFIWVFLMFSVISLMMVLFWFVTLHIWLSWIIMRRIDILGTVNVTVIFITWKICIVDWLWTIIISRSWWHIFPRFLLVIIISIWKLSLNWRIVERITIKMQSWSFINEFRLQKFMWIRNYCDFVSTFDVIIKGFFKLVISVNKLVMVLTIIVSATIRLSLLRIMSLLEVLISASVSVLILLSIITVLLWKILVKTSFWMKVIVISSLIVMGISLIVVLICPCRWFILMCVNRTFTIPEKFFLSENLFLDFFIFWFYHWTVLNFFP